MSDGRTGAARVTGSRAIISSRLVCAPGRGGLRSRTWGSPRQSDQADGQGRDQGARLGRPATPDQATPTSRLTTTPKSTPGRPGSNAKARVICRFLEVRGLSSDEAARLTAFLHGLPTSDLGWSPAQLNRLLFLRQLREAGACRGRTTHPPDLRHRLPTPAMTASLRPSPWPPIQKRRRASTPVQLVPD